MYVILWEFRARSGREKEFERTYGAEGVWANFFRTGEGYLGTELFRDVTQGARYLTIDRWISQSAYEDFRRVHQTEYETIDERCEALTEQERRLGSLPL